MANASGLLGMLGVQQNPFTSWLGDHSNTLVGLGSGIASGQNLGQGLGLGLQYGGQGRAADISERDKRAATAQEESQKNATLNWFKSKGYDDLVAAYDGGAPLGSLWQEAIARSQPQKGAAATSDIQNYEYGLTHPGFAETLTQKGGQAETALTPTYGKMTDWKQGGVGHGQAPTVVMQLNKAGQSIATRMPPGVTPIAPDEMAGAKTSATVDAKTAGAARAALPGAQQAVAIAKNAIDLIRNDTAGMDQQFGNTLGIPNRNIPTIPGVFMQEKGNWQANFAQAKGQAFMQARNMLKGGGPITDYEGMKGEAAYSRMEQAAAIGDEDNFKRALDDFEAAVDDGYKKLVETAGGAYSAPNLGTNTAPVGNGYRVLSVE